MSKFNLSPILRSLAVLVAVGGMAHAQAPLNKFPAARQHVKFLNNQPFKYTTKLTKVIELNFTFNYHHNLSKPLIAATLTRVAENYGTPGAPAFTVQRFIGPSDGTAKGAPNPAFTLNDLLSGQVIFANQTSGIGDAGLGTSMRSAIQTAVETNGVGYFHLHGSGDDETKNWTWFTNSLHPMNYKSHGDRTLGPVYKNPLEKEHIVTENVLTQGMTTKNVPTSVDGSGTEVTTDQPTREIRNEWYRFGDDIRAKPELAGNLTVLSLYDPRNLGTALPAEYRRKGGNMYTYLFKVGAGMTHYLPAGHDNSEIMDPGGFDGQVGDWDRYFAQTLFFLAGYTVTACDASCDGLPVVSTTNHLTGYNYSTAIKGGYNLVSSDLKLDGSRPEFSFSRAVQYEAQLVSASGKVALQSRGKAQQFAFNTSKLSNGVYFMRVKVEGNPVLMRRYAIASR